MKKKQNSSSIWIIGIVVVTGVVAVFIYANRKNQGNANLADPNRGGAPVAGQKTAFSPQAKTPVEPGPQTPASPATDTSLTDKVKETVKDLTTPRRSLKDIVKGAKTWMPSDCHKDWIGKAAPDCTVQDLSGKQHRLSEYRGKNVIIALFAPSFAPSLPELKMFSQLQDSMGQDQLVVLGLSFDGEGAVRRYMEGKSSISFPIVAGKDQTIPAPYSEGKPMPGALFISPDGTLKLSTRGLLPVEDARAILAAK